MKHIILSLLIFAMISVQVLARDKLALVVGNNSYSGMFDSLNNSVNDARKMAKALEDLGFKVMLKLNASQETMELAIDKFGKKLSKNSVGLFYFSGNAVQYKDVNYLVPTNFIKSSNKLRHRATPVDFVLAEMKIANNGLNIVILDACSNILEDIQDKSYGDAGGLGKMQAISGSAIVYANQPSFKSCEDKTQVNSYYTKHLLRFIKQDNLNLIELFSKVSLAVSKETKGKQEPWTSFLSLPTFCLAGCKLDNDIDKLLKTCQFRFDNNWLTSGGTGTALDCYEDVFKLDANNFDASQGLVNIENRYVAWIKNALKRGKKVKGCQYLSGLRLVNPESPKIEEFEGKLEPICTPITPPILYEQKHTADEVFQSGDDIKKLLKTCQYRFDNNWLTSGDEETDLDCYKDVLKLDTNNFAACQGLVNIENRYVSWAENALKQGKKAKVRQYLASLRLVNPESPKIEEFEKKLKPINMPTTPIAQPINYEQKYTADEVFQDQLKNGVLVPKMVVIPAGGFRMGDIQGGGDSDEKPVHWVDINYQFAAGKYEVKVGEFRQFVNATNYKTDAEKGDGCHVYDGSWGKRDDANWRNPYFPQTNNQPVVCISWNDAVAYTKWLSKQTAKEYRLPSEAEWEYVARAGTATKQWWGNSIGKNRASCDGCGAKWGWDAEKMTAPVGSFSANKFGLYDTVGNVWDWCADKWHGNYKNAPTNGSIWDYATSNKSRVLRGGSWYDSHNDSRSADSLRYNPDDESNFIGFRVFLSL